MNKKFDKLLKFMAIGCCTFAIALIVVIQQKELKIQKFMNGTNAIAQSYTTTESNSWDVSANGDGTVTATLDENGLLTISGTGAMKNWTNNANAPWLSVREQIKSAKIEKGITNIGMRAFYNCYNLISVEIQSSVISIGEDAFESCYSLTNIEVDENNITYKDNNGVLYSKDGTKLIKYSEGRKETEYEILSSVTSIGNRAFYNCYNLISIEIPNSVTSIGNYAFYGCGSLTSIEIPNGVTNIGNYAFRDCYSLTNIYVPNSVTRIGYSALGCCYSLTNIEVDENNTVYKDNNGVLFNKDGTEIITYPAGKKDEEYEILSSVISIRDGAFLCCNNLTSIEIPNSVTSIGNYAFYYCASLTNIYIPNSVTSIGNYALAYPRWITVDKIQRNATRIEIASGVTSIGNYAFAGRQLTEIEIPSSVTSIGDCAFDGSKIVNMISAESNTIELPDILKRLQDENDILYSEIKLTNCTLEGTTVKIEEGQTYGTINVSNGKLEGLIYIISSDTWDVSEEGDGNVMATLSDDGTLTISGAGDTKDWTYTDRADWHIINENIKNVIIENGVTSIGDYAFNDCYNLEKIEIPRSVVDIGEATFETCCNLEDIEIPNSVTSIGDGAFNNCYSLTNIEIPNSVTSIGNHAFYYCHSLISIEVDEYNTEYMDDEGVLYTKDGTKIIEYPEGKEDEEYTILSGATNIGDGAFNNCYSLTNIEIPNSVTSIGENAFMECYNLANIYVPNSVTSIGDEAFCFCENLTSIDIPESVTEIGSDAFYGCESLTNIYVPNSVTSIGDCAFDDCDNLTLLCYNDSTAATYAQENDINYLIIMDEIQTTTTVQQIKQQIGTNVEYKITDKNGEILADDKQLTTGCQIETSEGEKHIIIIEGDTNGDGNADIKDILAINKYRLNKSNLGAEYLLASDVNEDSVADIRDILQINKFRLGKTESL